MSAPIVEIKNISKRYQIGAQKEPYLSLRDEVMKWVPSKKRQGRKAQGDFWALDDISFNIMEGEAVGIIGRNGAGKSTLLKVLSQITPPTKGTITMRGRVASLLEVGTGFHPELTGRENIFLNGAILGMRREEIKRKFDEIIAFAEVEKFLDTPVKRYSSGMYVRLAFAVAAHLEPEILIVDEVLAVGDAEFQNKCIGKMHDVANSGRTVLFVSHNMAAVGQLCNRGIVLSNGKVSFEGAIDEAVNHYLRPALDTSGEVTILDSSYKSRPQDQAKFVKVSLMNPDNVVKDSFFIGESLVLSMDIRFFITIKSIQLSFIVRSINGTNIYHCVAKDAEFLPINLNGLMSIKVSFPALALYPGTYIIDDLWLASSEGIELDHADDVIAFKVHEGGPNVGRNLGKDKAIIHEIPAWSIEISPNS